MKPLKRIRYYTMSSWNLSTSIAYNLKVYNVIDTDLQGKVFELMETDLFWPEINELIFAFNVEDDYQWQAGFNGRSGGYLVLYRGGKHDNGIPFSYPGKQIEDDEIPTEIKKKFRQLALGIVKTTEWMARNCNIVEEEILVPKKIKTLVEA